MRHLIKVTDSLLYKTNSLEQSTAKQKGRTCINIEKYRKKKKTIYFHTVHQGKSK